MGRMSARLCYPPPARDTSPPPPPSLTGKQPASGAAPSIHRHCQPGHRGHPSDKLSRVPVTDLPGRQAPPARGEAHGLQ